MRPLKITKSITNREQDSVEKYLSEIGKVQLIEPEEEAVLARKIKEGDQAALDKLVKANLRFVVSVAKQYQNQGLSLSDLINEGNLGLIKAAQRFDETRGFKFISYGVWWIRQSILQALAEQSRLVRLPQNKIALTNKIQKVYLELQQEFEREPSAEELAELLEIEVGRVDAASINSRSFSLDGPLPEGDGDTSFYEIYPDDILSPDAELEKESLQRDLEEAFKRLSPKQQEILKKAHGIGYDFSWSHESIADEYNLTKERVRQIIEKSEDRLATCKNLRQYRPIDMKKDVKKKKIRKKVKI
ncbi:MAG TPA: RNA polymerase sigma factor RpoD/SigA [Candidatus Paceibacterota bacterium]|nr:RNA polymerase sigma factor RpoD/SigA [Candidatus Paceibacterota bacterium]